MKEIVAMILDRALKTMGREDGAAAVEYALIAGLVAVVIVPAVSEVGIRIREIFQTLADAMAQ